MKYNITHEQMRFILWIQIVLLFTLWGAFLVPFTGFYYLGWKKENLEEDTGIRAFLFKKKNVKEVKEAINSTVEPVVTLIRKVIGLIIALGLFYPIFKTIESFIIFYGAFFTTYILDLPHNETVVSNLEALGSILGFVLGVVISKSIYNTITSKNKDRQKLVKNRVGRVVLMTLTAITFTMGLLAWIALDGLNNVFSIEKSGVWSLHMDGSSLVKEPFYPTLESCTAEGSALVDSGVANNYGCNLNCSKGYPLKCESVCDASGCIGGSYGGI